MKKLIPLLLLASCVTVPHTPAEHRRVIEGQLRSCLAFTCDRTYFERMRCFREEEAACAAAGLEKSCGDAEILTNPPRPWHYGQHTCFESYY